MIGRDLIGGCTSLGGASKYPSEECLKGDRGFWGSAAPAMKQYINEDIHAKKNINSSWTTKSRFSGLKTQKVIPFCLERYGMEGQVTRHLWHYDCSNVDLLRESDG